MNIKYIAFILFICFFTSCKKFLDVTPKGRLIPVTVNDFDKLLDNTDIVQWDFLDNGSGSSLAYLTDNLSLSQAVGEIAYKANNHPSIERYYGYVFRQPIRNPNTSDFFWDIGTYRSTAYFNNVIEGVTKAGNVDEYSRQVIAQARVNRAWSYLITTMVYGPVYKPGGNNSRKTIPYVTSPDVIAAMPNLSTQEEMFKYVYDDIQAALPDLPRITSWPSRPNKATGLTLLAYYYMFTGQFDKVLEYTNQAWLDASGGDASKVIYDYNTFFWANPANVISSELKGPDNLLSSAKNREMLFYRNTDVNAGRSSNSYPSDEIKALYNQNTDLRYKYFFLTAPGYKTTYSGTVYDDGQQVQYYRGAKTLMTSGFTFPELLLMRAEAYARTNKPGEAINDLNTLRKFRYVTGTANLVAGTQDEVIQMVLDERRRELPLAHFKRFLDLKRFTLDAGKSWSKTKIVHHVGSSVYEGTIDSDNFILPISNTVLRFNPEWGIPLETRPF